MLCGPPARVNTRVGGTLVDWLIGALSIVGGILLVLWGAERFTDGAIRTSVRLGLSVFAVGAIVSGFEPENLVTGGTAAFEHLPQIALGTVIGSAIFMLTAGLGVTLLLVPMEVRIPREGGLAMLASLAACATVLWNDGTVTRNEGAALVILAAAVMVWLSRSSPAFRGTADDNGSADHPRPSGGTALGLLVAGFVLMIAGAELIVYGARTLVVSVKLSETFLGMAVIGMGESLEETARMVTPARRGHAELAWGNVVGTIVVLLTFNLGVLALIRPLTAEPVVLRFHAPYLIGCTIVVATALFCARSVGRRMGLSLVVLYLVYLAVNLTQMR
jgi:cation:H+ antiporter